MVCTCRRYGLKEMHGKTFLGVTKATDHEEAKGGELAHRAAQRRAFVSRVVELLVTHESS